MAENKEDLDRRLFKLNEIEAQLDELKQQVPVPDYQDILAGFEWTKAWFRRIEDVLLDLAYRGEKDADVVYFIRQKILDIDVRTFNKFLESIGNDRIDNHYDYIIEKKLVNAGLYYNNNDAIADYILSTDYNVNRYHQIEMSSNTNSKIVTKVLEDNKSISWNRMLANTNKIAVDYILSLIWLPAMHKSLSFNEDDRIAQYLVNNPDVIDYSKLSQNTNDIAITHLLKNADKIDFDGLSRNPNTLAVLYLLENTHLIVWKHFNINSNPEAVNYLINNPEHIKIYYFKYNTNENAIKHLLKTRTFDELYGPQYNAASINCDIIIDHALTKDIIIPSLSRNPNDRVLEHLMKNKHLIIDSYITDNNCNYNMQKLRAFDNAKLFERLSYLRLR